jgi:hypothetical protein
MKTPHYLQCTLQNSLRTSNPMVGAVQQALSLWEKIKFPVSFLYPEQQHEKDGEKGSQGFFGK